MRASALAAAVVVLLVSCGSGDRAARNPARATITPQGTATTNAERSASTTTVPKPAMTAPRKGPEPPPPALRGASTSARSEPPVGPIAYLTSVRAARHPGFDRVVFEFRGARPGFQVRYRARPVHEAGSGRVIQVDGTAVLEVGMAWAATAQISDGKLHRTYRGPSRVRPSGTPIVTEVVKAGDFEAVLTWVVGTRAHVPFRVFTLEDPSRLVVDLAHSS